MAMHGTGEQAGPKRAAAKPFFSPQLLPYMKAIVSKEVSSLMLRHFMFMLFFRFVSVPMYLQWVASIFNFTWAASHGKEWLGTFLGPDDPTGDLILISGWMWILQIGRFACLYLALSSFLATRGTTLTEVWSNYWHFVFG